jgi:heme/copper-type cytochrome/quinol oxidase subunit 4
MSMVRKPSLWWSLIIILSAAGTTAIVVSGVGPPVRPVIVFWFLLICPGMALTRPLHLKNSAAELTVGIALSIALDTTVAEMMVLAGHWSPEWALVVLAGISVAGAALQITTAPSDTASREIE